jgi:sugar lactone lactonase YvrE
MSKIKLILSSVLLLLASCGGGESEPGLTSTPVVRADGSACRSGSAGAELVRGECLAVLRVLAPQQFASVQSDVPLPTPSQLFAWAESAYPQYFAGASDDGFLAPYTYRHYAGTQTYIGVDTAQNVYVLGPVSNGAVMYVGPLSSFTCRVNPAACALPPGTVSTLAGSGATGSANGGAAAASFNLPSGVAVDSSGKIYVADTNNNAVRVVSGGSVITLAVGRTCVLDETDQCPADVTLARPQALAYGGGFPYVADSGSNAIRRLTGGGAADLGSGYSDPKGIAADNAGNVYVADTDNNLVKKITPAGSVSSLPGSYNRPAAVAVDSSGQVYVADTGANLIKKISPTGTVSILAGTGLAGAADGAGSAATMNSPRGLAVDSAGNVYFSDFGNNLVRKITPEGTVGKLAGDGAAGFIDGDATLARFNGPAGLAIDSNGNIYVADSGNQRIRKISSAATAAPTFGLSGTVNGLGNAAGLVLRNGSETLSLASGANSFAFLTPLATGTTYGVSVQSQPQGLVCGVSNGSGVVGTSAVSAVTVNCSAGAFLLGGTVSGLGGVFGLVLTNGFEPFVVAPGATSFLFSFPVAVGDHYNIAVAVQPAGLHCEVSPNGSGVMQAGSVSDVRVTCAVPAFTLGGTVSGLGNASGLALSNSDGQSVAVPPNATSFLFGSRIPQGATYAVSVRSQPAGYTCRLDGGSGVMPTSNVGTITVNCVREPVTLVSTVTTLAGGLETGFVNGTGSAALFGALTGTAVDTGGNVYVADTTNYSIRKITSSGIVTTLAGSGTPGAANGVGVAASFDDLGGLAVDANGNVYVADFWNNLIRKITPAGLVTTLAGSGSPGMVDATGTAAKFFGPQGIAVDGAGYVYVTDTFNNRIRKISPAGVVTTLAGSGATGSADGPGATATFGHPAGLAADAGGNVYVADSGNALIRKISTAGAVTTFAGPKIGSAKAFTNPTGIAVDGAGNVYVADIGNYTIYKVSPTGAIDTLAGTGVTGTADGPGNAATFALPNGVAVSSSGVAYISDRYRVRKITQP